MLIEFRVRNFRSIREEAVLSMAASPDVTLLDSNATPTGLDKIRHVVNTAGIFGANASGKTSLIKALAYMQSMVQTSNQIAPNAESNLMPFRMREDFRDHPSLFELTLLLDGVRYQYGFEATRTEVRSEWLLVYESAKPQVWFSRTWEEQTQKYSYSYSDYFVGPKKVWETATRREVLFLSLAIQLNNEQLRPLFQAISDIVIFENGPRIGFDFTSRYIEQPQNLSLVTDYMRAADTGISGVRVEVRPGKVMSFNLEANKTEIQDTEMKIPFFSHAANGEAYECEWGEESSGTQTLFGLLGPILDIIEKGKLLVIDELDSSLHPLMVREILSMFHNPHLNKNGAQLVFTSHDTSLLNSDHLRRDQIWLVEKDAEQASHLFPLLDFSPRKGEALEKNYLAGRYGGIPIIDRLRVH